VVYLLKPRWDQFKFPGANNILIYCQAYCKAAPAGGAEPCRSGPVFREVGMQGTRMPLPGFGSVWWRDRPQKCASAESSSLGNRSIEHRPGWTANLLSTPSQGFVGYKTYFTSGPISWCSSYPLICKSNLPNGLVSVIERQPALTW